MAAKKAEKKAATPAAADSGVKKAKAKASPKKAAKPEDKKSVAKKPATKKAAAKKVEEPAPKTASPAKVAKPAMSAKADKPSKAAAAKKSKGEKKASATIDGKVTKPKAAKKATPAKKATAAKAAAPAKKKAAAPAEKAAPAAKKTASPKKASSSKKGTTAAEAAPAEEEAAPEAAPAKKASGGKKGSLSVGDKLPDFSVETDTSTADKQVLQASQDLTKDHGAVIFFYPKANTGGCTKQAQGFQENAGKIKAAGYKVFGMSADKPKSQTNWKAKYSMDDITLLSDPSWKFLKALGVTKGEKSIARSHIIIGKGGAIEDLQIGVSPGDSVSKAVAFIVKS